MWIVRLALRRPYTVLVSVLLVFLFGVLSLKRLQRDILPNIDIPVAMVIWNFPGLSADDMEKRVVFITERAFSTTINGISRIESQSLSGIGLLKVYFEEGTDIGSAIAQIASVSNTITRVLPPGITPPAILQYNASNVQVAQLTLKSETLPEQALFDYGFNFLRLRLFTIPGLSTPAPYGGKQRQIMVDIDPARLKATGVSPQDVVSTIVSSNVILPAGSARIGSLEYDVLMNASPTVVADFNAMPVKVVNGVPVLMGDVAYVHDGYAVQQNIVRVNGRRATYLAILRKAGSSTLAVVDAVRELLPMIKATAPAGLDLSIDFDQSIFVRAAIGSVLREAAIAAGLVSVMIFFFLGSLRSVIIVCTSIPVAILSGVVGLYLTGQTLNLMTLGGLALAVGMLVDDATVEVENIARNRGMNKPLTVAILDAAHQVAVPALAATTTICIVFFPVVMLVGPARFLFTPLALAVVFSMIASYLLSRTLVPSLSRRLLRNVPVEHPGELPPGRHQGRLARFGAWRDRGFERLRDGYSRLLASCLAHRTPFLLGVLVFAVIGISLVTVVGLDFFPSVDTGQMRLHVRAPTGRRIEDTELDVSRTEREIRKLIPADEIQTINDNIGVPTYYNLAFVSTDNVGGWDAEILIQLRPKHHPSEKYRALLRRELAERLPDLKFYFMPADVVTQVLNFGVPAMIDVQIEGRDPDASFEVARKLFGRMRHVPGAEDVRIAQVFDRRALRLDVDRQQAALLNLSMRDVANSLLASLSSSLLTSPSYWIDPKTGVNYGVAVQTPIPRMASVPDLLATSITPPTGLATSNTATNTVTARPTPVQPPLATQAQLGTDAPYVGGLATLVSTADRASINHYTVQPIVDVQASVDGRDLGAASSDVRRLMAEVQLPKGTTLTLRGQSQSMTTSFRDLGAGMLVAIALVYLLLMTLFQSARDPLVVMVAVPGSFVGILWMLVITGTTLNVESFMGSIMAVGIAVSNSILLVSFANEARGEREEMTALEAAMAAGRTRLRPVLMTALAMILGMLPTAFGLGEGGEQNAPLGRAVIGGLLMATLVTLFVVPTVYTLLRKAPPSAQTFEKTFAAEARGASGEPAGS
jgi:multidrug efflux pump subunit AcrB